MTDRRDEDAAEIRAIEQALDRAMATGHEPRLLRGGEGADAAAVREYTELLGLLPYALDAEEPPARLRGQILRRLTAAEDATSAPGVAPVAPFPPPAPAVQRQWSQLAMAAALAVCLLGLGFLGSLAWQQDRQIDQLQAQLATASPVEAATLQTLGAQVHQLRDRLDMVTTVARQAYPMRRVSQGDAGSQPDGIVYVCGNHQRWYLSLRGLEPPAEGDEYRLWFLTDGGKVDGGRVEVRPGAPIELEAMSMPDGTHGFVVTLEKLRQGHPESLTILLGEKAINL